MGKFNLGSALEGAAYGVLNELLAGFRDSDGYATQSRYEVVLHAPTGRRGNQNLLNIFSQVMQEDTKQGVARRT